MVTDRPGEYRIELLGGTLEPPSTEWRPGRAWRASEAVAAGAADRDAMVLETLLAFKRAGCSGVLTYHAVHAARLLGA